MEILLPDMTAYFEISEITHIDFSVNNVGKLEIISKKNKQQKWNAVLIFNK